MSNLLLAPELWTPQARYNTTAQRFELIDTPFSDDDGDDDSTMDTIPVTYTGTIDEDSFITMSGVLTRHEFNTFPVRLEIAQGETVLWSTELTTGTTQTFSVTDLAVYPSEYDLEIRLISQDAYGGDVYFSASPVVPPEDDSSGLMFWVDQDSRLMFGFSQAPNGLIVQGPFDVLHCMCNGRR